MHPEDLGQVMYQTLRFTNQLILIPNLLPSPLSILVCVESNQIRASNLILQAAKEKGRERVRPWCGQRGPLARLARARTRVSRLTSGKKTGTKNAQGLTVFQQGHWIPLNQ